MCILLHMLKRVTIVGSGSWATALVKLFSDSGIQVSWWVRSAAQADYINKEGHNPRYLSFAKVNTSLVTASEDGSKVFRGSEMILFAPHHFSQCSVSTEVGISCYQQIAEIRGMK